MKTSLHFTVRGDETLMKLRAAHRWPALQPAFQQACASCHGVGRAEDVTVKHK